VHWSHVGLNCRDQRASEEFYGRLFGFERARVVPLGDSEIVFLRQGDVYLELFQAPDDAAAAPVQGTARRVPESPGTWPSRPTTWTGSWPGSATPYR